MRDSLGSRSTAMIILSVLLRIGAAALGLAFLRDALWALRGRKFRAFIVTDTVFSSRLMQGVRGRIFGLVLFLSGVLLLFVAWLGIGS